MKKSSAEDHKKHQKLNLHREEIAMVRPAREISATLDEERTLEGLPFMPEMSKYCGLKFKVFRSVNKLIIEGFDLGMRRLKNTVILEGVACNGEYHGGCQRTCFLLWKEAWLDRIKIGCKEDQIINEILIPDDRSSASVMKRRVYECQSTGLIKATSSLPVWNVRRYIWDITSGTYKPLERLMQLVKSLFQRIIRIIGQNRSMSIHGRLKKTPATAIDLRPGDVVEVRSQEEILETLDTSGRNRGLVFTAEMLEFCGKSYRVLKKLDKMINEATGELRELSNTVLLEGGNCNGKAHGGCQRMCHTYWREIWLRKVS